MTTKRRVVRKHAFLLYSPQDSQFSRPLYDVLRGSGYSYVHTGKDWLSIEKEAKSRASPIELIVILWSEHASRSASFSNMIGAAVFGAARQDIRIMTIALDRTPLPSSLYRHIVVDYEPTRQSGRWRRYSTERIAFILKQSTRPSNYTRKRESDRFGGSDLPANRRSIVQVGKASKLEKEQPSAASPRAEQVKQLAAALRLGRLTLFCGAGVSSDAKMPNWNDLLSQLVFQMVKRLSAKGTMAWNAEEARHYLALVKGSSPLIVGKQLKLQFGDEFPSVVKEALYSTDAVTGALITEIVDLARPQRDSRSLDSIVTFNFDALIEENLKKAHVAYRTIYSETDNPESGELPIYHVHGYLPRNGKIPKKTNLVFSEDGYHSQFLEPFSWANLIQLQKLTQNTCLLVGISLTDPNMRRLIDVAWRKGEATRHYIIMKVPPSRNSNVGRIAKDITEQDANALGLNVIWVKSYSEIPKAIRSVRESAFPASEPIIPKAARKTATKQKK